MRCRLVTWNIHSCVGAGRRHDPLRVADVLGEIEPDVVGLQEVDWRHPNVDGMDQLALLADRLGLSPVAGPNLRDHRGEYGNGLLTRYAVERFARLDLSHGRREPRGMIDALLRCGDFTLRAMVTHLGLSRRERRRQAEAIRRALEEHAPTDAAALMGDMNEWLHSKLSPDPLSPDPFPVTVRGRTYPSRFPAFMLDRVMLRPAPVRVEHRVVRTRAARCASDHLPMVVDVEW